MTGGSLGLTRKELGIHRGLHHGALTRQQRKVTSRISHPVQIDQILVSPVLSERNGIGESVVFTHPIATPRVLRASDGLGERGVRDVGVELTDGYFGFDKVVRAGRIGKDDRTVRVGRVRGGTKVSVGIRNVSLSPSRWSSVAGQVGSPMPLVLSEETGR